MPKVVVIGGGPAGMMAAITAAENGNEVLIIEKMPSFGRKLLITGKPDSISFIIPTKSAFLSDTFFSSTSNLVPVKSEIATGKNVSPTAIAARIGLYAIITTKVATNDTT